MRLLFLRMGIICFKRIYQYIAFEKKELEVIVFYNNKNELLRFCLSILEENDPSSQISENETGGEVHNEVH